MNCSVLHDIDSFSALRASWPALCAAAEATVFESYPFVAACWDAVAGSGERWLLAATEGEDLVGAWPLWLGATRVAGLHGMELRGLGDHGLGAGPVAPLCRSGREDAVAAAFAQTLAVTRGWDTLEAPAGPRKFHQALLAALPAAGIAARSAETQTTGCVALPSAAEWDSFVASRSMAARFSASRYQVRAADATLVAELGTQWPLSEHVLHSSCGEGLGFLSRLLLAFSGRDDLRVGLLRSGEGAAEKLLGLDVAVIDSQPRRLFQLARLTQSEDDELLVASLHAAVRTGLREFYLPSTDVRWQSSLHKAAAVLAWNDTAVGRIRRGIAAVRDLVSSGSNVDSALRVLDRLRSATPEALGRAVGKVAHYAVFHLYRGELFTRDLPFPEGVELREFSHADFAALPEGGQSFCSALGLDRAYCEQKWQRGDLVVLARLGNAPVGIAWCARSSVFVPDLGCQVKPSFGECYIHDVFVTPEARGRQVAPAMLDFLARKLRALDVYRAWALIERSNTASTRAFEKAAYASIADVI